MISYEYFMKKTENEKFNYFLQVVYRATGKKNMDRQSVKKYIASLGMEETTHFFSKDVDFQKVYNNIVELYKIGSIRIRNTKESTKQKNEDLKCKKNEIEISILLKDNANSVCLKLPKDWFSIMEFDKYNKKGIVEFYNDEIIIKKVKEPGTSKAKLSNIQNFLRNNNIDYEYLDKVQSDYTIGTIELKNNNTNIISIEEVLSDLRRVIGITIYTKDKSTQKLNKLVLATEDDVINILKSKLQKN